MSVVNNDTIARELNRAAVIILEGLQFGKLTSSICTSMMSHWSKNKEAWKRFAKMTSHSLAPIFGSTPTVHHYSSKFDRLAGDSIGFFTSCDSSAKEKILTYFFGESNTKEAETMLWFFLTLDTWRFYIPDLARFCNNDQSTAKSICDSIASVYFPAVPQDMQTPGVPNTGTSIFAFAAIAEYLQPSILTAYIHNIMEPAVLDNDANTIMSTFPNHWELIKDSKIFCPEVVLHTETVRSLFDALTTI